MGHSRRYRASAAACLFATQDACQPCHRKASFLSMATSRLSLARRDEAMNNLLAGWNTAVPVDTDGLAVDFPIYQQE